MCVFLSHIKSPVGSGSEKNHPGSTTIKHADPWTAHLLDTPLEPGPLAGLIVLDTHLLVVVDQPPLPSLLSPPAVLQTLLHPEMEFTNVL